MTRKVMSPGPEENILWNIDGPYRDQFWKNWDRIGFSRKINNSEYSVVLELLGVDKRASLEVLTRVNIQSLID